MVYLQLFEQIIWDIRLRVININFKSNFSRDPKFQYFFKRKKTVSLAFFKNLDFLLDSFRRWKPPKENFAAFVG